MDRTQYQPSRPAAARHAGTRPASSRSIPHLLGAAMVAGVLLGALDLLAQRSLPYPWANLANSGAVWALGAFAIGMSPRRGARTGAATGVVLLLVAVQSYYLAAVIFLHDSTATLWDETTVLWLVLAVIVGTIFGSAGSLIRSSRSGVRFGAAAFAGLIFLTEAIHLLQRSRGGQPSSHDLQTALIEFALAVIVPLALLTLTRTRPHS